MGRWAEVRVLRLERVETYSVKLSFRERNENRSP